MTEKEGQWHHLLGAISGSSLDGLDVALVSFLLSAGDGNPVIHEWKIVQSATIPFPDVLEGRLRNAPFISGKELCILDADLGKWIGTQVDEFLRLTDHQKPGLVCSHGHTVFHEPRQGMTCQIGHGAHIAEITGLPVVSDLRYADIAAGGVGAPLAPLADVYLFKGYDYYLNLGGISNLTHTLGKAPLAWDISGCNQLLNHLSRKLGIAYDKNGEIARGGKEDINLTSALHNLLPFRIDEPVALDNQQVVNLYFPVLDDASRPVEDLLRTSTGYIAAQISRTISELQKKYAIRRKTRLLATGGGALNGFMMELLGAQLGEMDVELVIPERTIIEFKEAALIALAGLFRKAGLPNSLPSVTFARHPSIGGALHLPGK